MKSSTILLCLQYYLALIKSGKLDTSKKPVLISWLIDGTNLQCCGASGGGRMERKQIIEELEQIASPSNVILSSNDLSPSPTTNTVPTKKQQRRKQTPPVSNVVLVFDGNEEEDFQEIITEPWFQVIITDGKLRLKDRADDYIVHQALPQLQQRFPIDRSSHVVHLVSADKELRKRATATRMMNGGSLVYPPKFWKQYLPNLQQQQQQQPNRATHQSQQDS